ncbi:MAG: hypothetical protein JO078_06625 [Candidatus Eremiobacteraeota bacterium]|nr:hypothetical protein [Candidatus Eremiobacteraeota bacterium]MBV9055432.1 hypothetical protein [Candidatus Eremiobacteraeota bacterium]MBV9699781.1 hypothetical protein [Candidatus Eremiobacteraeota bacterium]
MANQERVSFAADIRPLFRQIDIDHMRPRNVHLDDFAFMSKRENATTVYDFLTGKKEPQMPPDEPWSSEQLDLFNRWMENGCQA